MLEHTGTDVQCVCTPVWRKCSGQGRWNIFCVQENTFIYGANLDVYPVERFDLQERMAQTTIEKIGTLDEAVFTEIVACLSESKW